MSNSPLVDYIQLSPNYSSRRGKPIITITPHHAAGGASVEGLGNTFASTERAASANYGIGKDGRVGLYVDESNRAWTSSSEDNDIQAITIEVANDSGGPDWHVSDLCIAKLIALCVDICQRNGIERLNYTGDATGNLTRHNMFAATTCPGPYLQSKFPFIAEEVNKRLEEDKPMTNEEKARFEALEKTVGELVNENQKLKSALASESKERKQRIEKLEKAVEPCVTSVNWDAHITGAMGGKEAVAMINDLKAHGDFAGKDKAHYALSEQMVRMMLIFYRILKRLGLYK